MNAKKPYSLFSINTLSDARRLLPVRPERSSKGNFGRVLCVCGSQGMAGAAFLCAKGAYRMGAGLVEIFTHESNRIILQTLIPEAIVTVYDEYREDTLISALERADCVVAGCGLGITPSSRNILSDLLHNVEFSHTPLVLDADALNLIARSPSLLKHAKGAVITPHAKEMSRLTGKSIEKILAAPTDVAFEYAQLHGLTCVLKDHHTVTTNGTNRLYINKSGNSGMSTGGSGDVLSGILGGLLAQGRNSSAGLIDTVALGVYIHGLCGDRAAKTMTEYSVMAGDLTEALPAVLGDILKSI